MDLSFDPDLGLGETFQAQAEADANLLNTQDSAELAKLAQEVDSVLESLQDWQVAREQHLREYTAQLATEYGFAPDETLSSVGGHESTTASSDDGSERPLGLTLVEGLLAIREHRDAELNEVHHAEMLQHAAMLQQQEMRRQEHELRRDERNGLRADARDMQVQDVSDPPCRPEQGLSTQMDALADPGGARLQALRAEVETLREASSRPVTRSTEADLGSTTLLSDAEVPGADDMEEELNALEQRLHELRAQGERLGAREPAMSRIQTLLDGLGQGTPNKENSLEATNVPQLPKARPVEAEAETELAAARARALERARTSPLKEKAPAAYESALAPPATDAESDFAMTAELDQLLADVNAAVG